MSSPRRYLPLFTPEENWIKRPDLFLLAQMGCEDSEGEAVVRRIYEAMCRSDNSRTELDSFDRTIEKYHVRRNLRERLWAGQVLLEMVRIAATTRKLPSQTNAIQLAIANHRQAFRKPLAESFERNVRRAFVSYRNTAHLQAAMVLQDPDIFEVENSIEDTVRFLSGARRLERFVDDNVVGGRFEWSPWRVPVRIPMRSNLGVVRLTKQELKLIGEP